MNFSHLSAIYSSQCGDNGKQTLVYGYDKSANCIHANRHSTLIEQPQTISNSNLQSTLISSTAGIQTFRTYRRLNKHHFIPGKKSRISQIDDCQNLKEEKHRTQSAHSNKPVKELEKYFTINAHNSLVSYKISNEMNAKISEQTPKMEVVRRDTFKLNTRNLFKFFSRDKKEDTAAQTSDKVERSRSDPRVNFTQIRLTVAASDGASFGFTIHGYCPCQVGKVEKSSPSEHSGLMPGDLIIKINGKNVSRATCDSVVRLIKSSAHQLTLELMRPCKLSADTKRARTNMYESIPPAAASAVNSTENELFHAEYNHLNEIVRPKKPKNMTSKKPKYSVKTRPKAKKVDQSLMQWIPSPIAHMSPESKKTSIITDSDYKTQSSAGTDEPANISAASCPPDPDDHLYLCEQLLNLEEKFIDTMQKGVQQYSRPLRHCLMIDQSQHCTIFQNIEKILAISEYQLNQLISQDDSILLDMFSTIGKLYENKMRMSSEAFDIYLHGVQKALRLLDHLSVDSNLSRFLTEAKDDIDMDLRTFLLVPVFYVTEIVHCLNKIKDNTLLVSSDYQSLVNLTHSLEPYCRRSQLVLAGHELHNPLKNVHIELDDEDLEACEPVESNDQAKLSLLYSGCVQYRQSCNKWKRIRLLFFHDRIILLSYNSNVDKFLGLLSKSCSNSWSVLDSLNEFTFKSISFKSVVSVHCEQAKCEFALRYSRVCTGPARTNKIKLKCSSGDNQRWNQLFSSYLCQF